MKKAILWLIGGAASLCVCSLMCYIGESLSIWWKNYDSFAMFPFVYLSMISIAVVGVVAFFFATFCLVVAIRHIYDALKQAERVKKWLE